MVHNDVLISSHEERGFWQVGKCTAERAENPKSADTFLGDPQFPIFLQCPPHIGRKVRPMLSIHRPRPPPDSFAWNPSTFYHHALPSPDFIITVQTFKPHEHFEGGGGWEPLQWQVQAGLY